MLPRLSVDVRRREADDRRADFVVLIVSRLNNDAPEERIAPFVWIFLFVCFFLLSFLFSWYDTVLFFGLFFRRRGERKRNCPWHDLFFFTAPALLCFADDVFHDSALSASMIGVALARKEKTTMALLLFPLVPLHATDADTS